MRFWANGSKYSEGRSIDQQVETMCAVFYRYWYVGPSNDIDKENNIKSRIFGRLFIVKVAHKCEICLPLFAIYVFRFNNFPSYRHPAK